jgi:ABC-type bacteriocin/lantibiotic exporter with double-glycine peptidase domain
MKRKQAAEKRDLPVLSFLAEHKAGMLYAFAMNLVLLVPAAMSPTFKKAFSNGVLDNAAEDWLPPLILTMFGAAFISGIATYLQRQCSLRLSERIEISSAADYVLNMLRSPAKDDDEFIRLSRIYAAKGAAGILSSDLLGACFSVVSIAIYLPLMFREDVFMTIVALGIATASIALSFIRGALVPKFAGGGVNPKSAETTAKRIGLYGLMSVPTIKASALEGRFFSALISARSASATAGIEGEKEHAYQPLDGIAQIVFMNLLLFVCAIRITQRSFTVGSYLAFQAYAAMLFEPMKTLFTVKRVFKDLKKRLARLNSFRGEVASEDAENTGAEPSGYALRVEGVPFTLENGRDAPQAALPGTISFYAPEGSRIVVTGGTERERTAFLRILAGLEPPPAGTVTVGGIAASVVQQREGKRILGYAAGRPVFFDGPLRDNLTFWDESIPDADILAALALAGLPVDIFAGELERPVTEGGKNLSVGERRRIELARGLLHNPKLLVVDDLLCRLDTESRSALENELMSRGVTLIASLDSSSAVTDADVTVSLDMPREGFDS